MADIVLFTFSVSKPPDLPRVRHHGGVGALARNLLDRRVPPHVRRLRRNPVTSQRKQTFRENKHQLTELISEGTSCEKNTVRTVSRLCIISVCQSKHLFIFLLLCAVKVLSCNKMWDTTRVLSSNMLLTLQYGTGVIGRVYYRSALMLVFRSCT